MWPFPRIIAHRGAGTLAPENTLAAMRCGLKKGFHAVEFDVMLSRDGIPVLMHDPLLGRTVAGKGKISDLSADELHALDAGKWFNPQFAGEPVPLFSEVIEFCIAHRIWMNVEIKPAPGFETETGRIAATVLKHYTDKLSTPLPLFSSFSPEALDAARKAAPDIPRGCLMDTISADWHDRLVAAEAIALHTNHKYLTPPQAQAVKAAGYGLFCYTVNDPARAREILSWGVDAFCTDRIDLIGADWLTRPL